MNNSIFLKGIKDGFPICLGYLSVSFAFGLFAVNSGLSVLEALLISMTNLTSAGQLAAVPIICQGGTLIELALSQLFINLRYALMSFSLSQKLDERMSLPQKLHIAFGNTDEIFAICSTNKGKIKYIYMCGLIITPFLGWSTGTLLGAIAGDLLPDIVISALNLAIYGMFIAITVPVMRQEKSTALCVFLAVILSFCFYFIPLLKAVPTGFSIIICSVTASAVFALAFPIKAEEDEEENDCA